MVQVNTTADLYVIRAELNLVRIVGGPITVDVHKLATIGHQNTAQLSCRCSCVIRSVCPPTYVGFIEATSFCARVLTDLDQSTEVWFCWYFLAFLDHCRHENTNALRERSVAAREQSSQVRYDSTRQAMQPLGLTSQLFVSRQRGERKC